MPIHKLTDIKGNPSDDKDKFFMNFLDGVMLEIHGYTNKTYIVEFSDPNKIYHREEVQSGFALKSDIKYYVDWTIKVFDKETNNIIHEYRLNLENANVLISYESSALGDTLCWMPYILEFKKKHNCNVIVSSFHNEMFESIYPEINFVPKGVPIQGIHVAYKIGFFGSGVSSFQNPMDCRVIPMFKIITDILGLDTNKEIRPNIEKDKRPALIKGKYIVITTCSTAQFKYYNRPGGWQEVIDWHVKKGYKVINVGKMPMYYKNCENLIGQKPMSDLINILQYADYFVGLPSGLAWLAWSLNKKTVMITGISEAFCEYREDNYRVEHKNPDICHGCFNWGIKNNKNYVFAKSDWLFCPEHKNTPKHFECTKSITPDMIFKVCEQVQSDIKTNTKHYSLTETELENYITKIYETYRETEQQYTETIK